MWTRGQLKNSAKEDLKGFYWLSLGACFVVNLISGGASGISGLSSGNLGSNGFSSSGFEYNIQNPTAEDWRVISVALVVIAVVVVFAMAIGFVYSAFLINPLNFGLNKFFVHRKSEDRALGTIFGAFKKGSYMNIVKTLFMRDIIVFLWGLLFIIPGIIKGYAYRLVPYIINDHPEMDYKEALARSQEMTNGEKFNMWVLDLSFIGWELLTILTCGIGAFFLAPYIQATWAQFYKAMCEKIGDTPVAVIEPEPVVQ